MIIAGIDPGRNTAIVAVELRAGGPRFWGSRLLRPSMSAKLSHAERDADLFRRIHCALIALAAHQVAIEEPLDISAFWATRQRKAKREQQGSTFRLGAYFGLALGAAASLGLDVTSYPVTGVGARSGWMQGKKAADVLTRMQLAARAMGGPKDLSEHELMALGVLMHHIAQAPPGSLRLVGA